MKKCLTLVFHLSFIGLFFVQAQNLEKANEYFEKTNYNKALQIYSDLIVDSESEDLLKKLGDCYYYTLNMVEASKYYKKLVDNYGENLDNDYIFKYAQSLKATNNKDADKWLKKYYQKSFSKIDFETQQQVLKNIKEKGEFFTIKNMPFNTEKSEFGAVQFKENIVFSASKKEITLNKKYSWNKQSYLDLYVVPNDSSNSVKPFSREINTKLHEATVTFSNDEQTVYFTRNNYINGKKTSDDNKINHLQIYRAEMINNSWTNITSMPFNSTTYSVEHPALSPDNKTLYFSSDMPGTLGSFDIFSVTINDDGTYGEPKNLGGTINTKQREQFPFVSKNGNLYFASDGHIGFGLLDVFKSKLKNDLYQEPLNVGLSINSEKDDFSFYINEKTNTGYFASNRTGGKGDDDIYSFTQINKLEQEFKLVGNVINSKTNEPIANANIKIFDEDKKLLKEFISKDGDWRFEIKLEPDTKYFITSANIDYLPYESSVTIRSSDAYVNNQTIKMSPIEKQEPIDELIVVKNDRLVFNLKPIYFDFNKWNIRADSQTELDVLVDKLNQYPKITLLIESHTDSRGNDSFNYKLSKKRAKSTLQYIINKGINKNRLSSKGFGETKPAVRCVSTRKCTNEEHQTNRRTEFVIVNYDLTN